MVRAKRGFKDHAPVHGAGVAACTRCVSKASRIYVWFDRSETEREMTCAKVFGHHGAAFHGVLVRELHDAAARSGYR